MKRWLINLGMGLQIHGIQNLDLNYKQQTEGKTTKSYLVSEDNMNRSLPLSLVLETIRVGGENSHGALGKACVGENLGNRGRWPYKYFVELLAGENNKFYVIEEFNCWRKKHDLAEVVAAIMALAAVIRESEATTMMELDIELRNASDALKDLVKLTD